MLSINSKLIGGGEIFAIFCKKILNKEKSNTFYQNFESVDFKRKVSVVYVARVTSSSKIKETNIDIDSFCAVSEDWQVIR